MGDDGEGPDIPVRAGRSKPRRDLDRDEVADELRTQGMRVAHVDPEPHRDEAAEQQDVADLFRPRKGKTSQVDPDTNKD